MRLNVSLLFNHIPGVLGSAGVGITGGSGVENPQNVSSGTSSGVGGGAGNGMGATISLDHQGHDYGDFEDVANTTNYGFAHIGPTVGFAFYRRKNIYCEGCASSAVPMALAQIILQRRLSKCIGEKIGKAFKETYQF